MKPRLQSVLLIIILTVVSTQPVRSENPKQGHLRQLTYTPRNLIAHNVARLRHDQNNLAEIRLVNFKLFGFDVDNALLTANYEAITDPYRDIPQVYALVLRTSDGGSTWTQVLDTIDRRISYIADVQFIARRGLLLYEHSMAGNSFGFLYSQDLGENWINSELEGISGSFYLVDWSVRRPQHGVAVIHSDSGIPIDGDPERETAYWVVESTGGFRWRIVRTIQRGDVADFDPKTIAWPSEWDALDDSWILAIDDGEVSVRRSEDGVEKRKVLSLPSGIIWTSHGESDS